MSPPDPSSLRILVIADLSGRTQRGLCDPTDLASRPLAQVDLDTLERVMARLAPALELPVGQAAGRLLSLDFRDPDGFHPDRLFRNLDLFKGLREMRRRLSDPATFPQAAAELRQQAAPVAVDEPPAAGSAPAATRPAVAGQLPAGAANAAAEGDASTLERLLGRSQAPAGADSAAPPPGVVENLIRSIVAPYIVPGPDPFQPQYVASVDTAIGELMRSILHHPDFQSLEAAWRGVQWLVTNLELGEDLELFVLDASRDELAADLAAAAGNPRESALCQRLAEGEADSIDGEPWSLLVGDFWFGSGADDVALLGALGAIAARAGAPLLAAAAPSLLGCASLARAPDPRQWQALDAESAQRWRALRESPAAEWIGLALPRILLRLPYGAQTDAIDSFAFEEFSAQRRHEGYLWGNPAFACALLIGQAFTADGWDMEPGDALDLEDLPAHTYREDGETRLQPCAEVLLGERAGDAMLAQGLTPLLGYKNRNAARVLRLQSIAAPARPLAGRWAAR